MLKGWEQEEHRVWLLKGVGFVARCSVASSSTPRRLSKLHLVLLLLLHLGTSRHAAQVHRLYYVGFLPFRRHHVWNASRITIKIFWVCHSLSRLKASGSSALELIYMRCLSDHHTYEQRQKAAPKASRYMLGQTRSYQTLHSGGQRVCVKIAVCPYLWMTSLRYQRLFIHSYCSICLTRVERLQTSLSFCESFRSDGGMPLLFSA